MRQTPKPYEKYRHFKGGKYQVLCVALHTETGEPMVVYQALYGEFGIFVRPLDMFMEHVDKEKYPGAAQEFRFELLEEADGGRSESGTTENNPGAEDGSGEAFRMEGSRKQARTYSTDGNSCTQDISGGSVMPEMAGEAGGTGEAADRKGSGEENPDGERGELGDSGEALSDLDPLLLEFLDADSYGKRLNILSALHHRITDDMINVMAMATDLEVPEGDVEERWMQLRMCLQKLARFECSR